MIGWELYVKRRGINPATFFKGCVSIDQAKQRIESKKVRPPDDKTIAELLEHVRAKEKEVEGNVVSLELHDAVSIETLPVVTVTVDPPRVIDGPPQNDDEDASLKTSRSRKKKQTSVKKVADEDDDCE
jgi:hypothetical protein